MARPRLTVLQMLPALEGGGVERGTLEVAGALAGAGHRSIVLSGGGAMTATLTAGGSEHVRWPVGAKSLLTFRFVRKLRRLLIEERVDVVHARSRVPAWVAWLALDAMPAATRPRLVTTVHGFYRVGRYSAVMTRGERVICVSRAIRDYVRTSYPEVPEHRLVTIPRGIDYTAYRHGLVPDAGWMTRWREDLGAAAGRRLLLLPGRLTRRKGHEDFLDLLAALLRDGVDVHGLVAGGEDPRRRAYASGLRERSRALGLEERVSFLGHRGDLREIMAVSDLVLSLSGKPESFGRTVLESLSLGRPTLGYAHGGVAEILDDLYPAGAVPPGDPARLHETAARLLTRPPPVRRRECYPIERMLADTLAQYEALVPAQPASSAE